MLLLKNQNITAAHPNLQSTKMVRKPQKMLLYQMAMLQFPILPMA